MTPRNTRTPSRRAAASALAILLGAALAIPAFAGDLFIFPNKDQTPEQQEQDQGACYVWAKNQSGFDPITANSEAPRNTEPNKGGVVRGGLGGAAVGAAVGAIAGNAGKGAAMGAAGGGLIGGMRRSSQRSEQKARKKDWENQQQGNRDSYLRAYTACLEGKGYTVK
jgi:hypothetical protein